MAGDDDFEARVREVAGDDIAQAIEDFLAPTEERERYVAARVHQEITAGVAKIGGIMAYRVEVRRDAIAAILELPEVMLTDMVALSVLQMRVARYLHLERYVQRQLGLHENAQAGDEGPGAESGAQDDEPGGSDVAEGTG